MNKKHIAMIAAAAIAAGTLITGGGYAVATERRDLRAEVSAGEATISRLITVKDELAEERDTLSTELSATHVELTAATEAASAAEEAAAEDRLRVAACGLTRLCVSLMDTYLDEGVNESMCTALAEGRGDREAYIGVVMDNYASATRSVAGEVVDATLATC